MLTKNEIAQLAKVRAKLLSLARELADLSGSAGEDLIRDVLFVGDTAHIRVHHSGTVVVQLLIEP